MICGGFSSLRRLRQHVEIVPESQVQNCQSLIKTQALVPFGGASSLSRPAVILVSRRRRASTRQGRLARTLAPPRVANRPIRRQNSLSEPPGGSISGGIPSDGELS